MLKLSKRKNRIRGFTLVEAMISILILGLIVGALLGALTMGKTSITTAGKDHIAARNLAQEKMEDLKAQSYTSLTRGMTTESGLIIDYGRDLDGDGEFDDGEGVDNEGEKEDELIGSRITQLQPINDDDGNEKYLKATVTVTWTKRLLGGTTPSASESLVTYIYR